MLKMIEAGKFMLAVSVGVLLVGSARAGQNNQTWGSGQDFGIDAITAKKLVGDACAKAGIAVAVIDTGVDSSHPDLKDSLWINQKELNGKKGVDDDGNGYVDDINGWDFVTASGKIVDQHGHGTHVAGIISASGKGDDGYSGICPGARIMSLRYYSEKASGQENLKNTIRGIEYAINNGARIINYSGGGAEFSQPEFKALQAAERKGILVSAAAGNERSNADEKLYYPAAYPLTNILSVAAINQAGQMPAFSNWGTARVHVAAPGASILSTVPGGGYGFMSGTSQATAFVSGVGAMLLSVNPSLSFTKLKINIESSVRKLPQLIGKTRTGGLVNLVAALETVGIKGTLPITSTIASNVTLRDGKGGAQLPMRGFAADPFTLPRKKELFVKKKRSEFKVRNNAR
jgi:subtilisin family serine protease